MNVSVWKASTEKNYGKQGDADLEVNQVIVNEPKEVKNSFALNTKKRCRSSEAQNATVSFFLIMVSKTLSYNHE